MKVYDVFESEGGFRVALEVCLGGPVIDKSPWFKNKNSAQRFAAREKAKAEKEYKEKEKRRITVKRIDMTKFKPYVVIDDATSTKAASFEEFYKTADEANAEALNDWNGLTEYDKRGGRYMCVGYVTPECMDMDLLDEDDDFNYNRPPWNGECYRDPNGVTLFDSRLYEARKKMLNTAYQKEPITFAGSEYIIMKQPKPTYKDPLIFEALAVLKEDGFPSEPYAKQYIITWNLSGATAEDFEDFTDCPEETDFWKSPRSVTFKSDRLLISADKLIGWYS